MNVAAIPLELRERPQWVAWRAMPREGKPGEWTKVPWRADERYGRASATNPDTWTTFDRAVRAFLEMSANGIGYVFAADDPYVGIDLDQGLSEADRMAIVAALDSYTETSPSGAGIHVIVRASLNGHGRNRKGPFEVYEQGRYFTITGNHVRGTPVTIEERQAQLDEVLAQYLPKRPESAARAANPTPVDVDDRALLDRMFSATNGNDIRDLYEGRWEHRHPSQSEADLALCSSLGFWTGA